MYPLHSSVGPVSSCEENTAGYLVWNSVAAVSLVSRAFKSIDVLEMINRKESLQYLSYACSTWNMPPKFFSLSKPDISLPKVTVILDTSVRILCTTATVR